jgi:hypothetical protein
MGAHAVAHPIFPQSLQSAVAHRDRYLDMVDISGFELNGCKVSITGKPEAIGSSVKFVPINAFRTRIVIERSGFRFAARAVAVVGVAFVVELFQAGCRGIVAADGLGAGDLEELS